MLNQRLTAARAVAIQLYQTEAAIDAALASTAELNALLPKARMDANISAALGHDALQCTGLSLTALIEARRAMVEAHRLLDEARKDIGLRERNFGGGMLKPSAIDQRLRIVNDVA
jgi:hypothetical protein